MKTKIIQVCGIYHLEDEIASFVSDEEATGYGVYIGQPGDFRWLRDFDTKNEALTYAEEVAQSNPNCWLDDLTYSDLEI